MANAADETTVAMNGDEAALPEAALPERDANRHVFA
jgi:hypothetical protein